MDILNIFHIIFGLFLYYCAVNKTLVNGYIFKILAFIVGGYHLYEVYKKFDKVPLINIYHGLFIAPFFYYLYYKNKVGYQEESMLYILAFGSIGIHLLRYLNN